MAVGDAMLQVGSGTSELARGLAELGTILDRHGVGQRPRFQAELVFEELVSNVIRYGYDDQELHMVQVDVRVDPKNLVLVVSDDGRPFNPLERADPALPDDIADAAIGGLGIMLVRKAARSVAYERTGGRNRLTVTIARA
jgi:anti-sigma regulatory factor (Ser/Thr protein kinase)